LALLVTPLFVFGLACGLPYYSARLSLTLHGLPFARVVPKEKLNVFQFVKTDSMAATAIVFSGGKAVGWICEPWGSFASYVAFSDQPSFEDIEPYDFWFNGPLLIAWSLRWWLLLIQAVILLSWLRSREKRVRYSVP